MGYVAALVLTVVIMIMYNHAQPALLYLVPANIGCRLVGACHRVVLLCVVALYVVVSVDDN